LIYLALRVKPLFVMLDGIIMLKYSNKSYINSGFVFHRMGNGMEWNVELEFIRWFGRLFHSFVCNMQARRHISMLASGCVKIKIKGNLLWKC
jgi:hypothetical protein